MIKISPLKLLHFEFPPKRNLIIKSLNYHIISLVICTLAYCFIGTSLFAQAYNPIQFGNTRWHYREQNFGGTTSYNYFSYDTNGHYFLGQKYWRIDRVAAQTYSPSTTPFYIYDDTTNRKVYAIVDTVANSIKLLYDFSAITGDTIFNIYSSGVNDTVKVDSVKYLLDQNNINRKHLFVHSTIYPQPREWVEGVGSTYDLTIPSFTFPDPIYSFICQEVNNLFSYGDSLQCNNFLTSINQIENTQPNITTTLNPFTHTLSISNLTNQQYAMHILNLNGQIIVQKRSNNPMEYFNLHQYQNQILIIKITTTQHQQITSKIYVH